MKIKEIRSLTTEELNSLLKKLKVDLFDARFAHVTGNLPNPMQLNTVKKDIAKVKTILREREIEANKKVNG